MKLREDVKRYLEFRAGFNASEWNELERAVEWRLKQKADKLELDDFDIDFITEHLKNGSMIKNQLFE